MKKQSSPNWGGTRPGSGRKPKKCVVCTKPLEGRILKLGRVYMHETCVKAALEAQIVYVNARMD